MAEKEKMKVACGDVGNAFLNAPTDENVHAVAGEEFGELQGFIVEIIRSLHGISMSSRSFALCLGNFMRTLGFASTIAGPDTWIKKDQCHEG